MTATNDKDRRLILGLGPGRCGLASLAHLLNLQPDHRVSLYQTPFLPWDRELTTFPLRDRIDFLMRRERAGIMGDIASFYLRYFEDIVEAHPNTRAVCMRRDTEQVVQSFARWLDRHEPLKHDHWSRELTSGWNRDPVWSRLYPKYEVASREEGIRRYVTEYYETAEALAEKYPEQLHVFDTERVFSEEAVQRELLTFIGVEEQQQVTKPGIHERAFAKSPKPPARAPEVSAHPLDPRRCIVLVPFGSPILPQCEESLRALERKGYPVRRVGGFAAIDQGRNQMATDAMLEGFQETMWIDSDVQFDPDSVEQLRAHQLPITCGIYPQKGKRAVAAHVMPGTEKIDFGDDGGVTELLYGATGFLHVRREVYINMQEQLSLPVCNERFGRPMLPYFEPMTIEDRSGYWYLAEDYSFCNRARKCGYKIMADTSIRLWHLGMFRYGWEDSGRENERYEKFTLHLGSGQSDGHVNGRQ